MRPVGLVEELTCTFMHCVFYLFGTVGVRNGLKGFEACGCLDLCKDASVRVCNLFDARCKAAEGLWARGVGSPEGAALGDAYEAAFARGVPEIDPLATLEFDLSGYDLVIVVIGDKKSRLKAHCMSRV